MEETDNSNLFLQSQQLQQEGRQKYIIVGFDPGLTVGIAILDLSGNLLSIKSCREISKAEIIKHIISYGKTVLIATDVYPPPKMVKKLASSLNSKIYSPYKVMTVGSKLELVDNYLDEKLATNYPENAHERDALAAAIKTYKHYQNKLNQIEKRAKKLGISDKDIDEIKSIVIKGRPISSAIDDVLKVTEVPSVDLQVQIEEDDEKVADETEEIIKKDKEIFKLKQKLKTQERNMKNLKKTNNLLEKDTREYKNKLSKLEKKLDKLYYEYSKDILLKKEISSKMAIIKRLQDKYTEEKAERKKLEENLRSIKKIRKMELSKKATPVKIIKSFTKEGIREACEYWKIKRGDVVLLSSSEGGGSQTALLLTQIGIKAVIIMDKMSHQAEEEFEKNLVPILDAREIDLKMIDEFAVIGMKTLNKEIEKWNEEIKVKRKKEEEKKILKVIDEYRAQRKRSNNQG